jgi:hypothetical protein
VNNNSSQSSALSSASPVVKLGSASPVTAVGSVSVAVKNQGQQAGNASDVTVNFAKASNETGIAKYRLFIVPADQVPGFTLNTAMNINYYNDLDKSSAGTTFALSDGYRDINNKSIEIGKKYRVFIMSVSDSATRSSSLSVASDEFSISNIVQSVQAAVITGLQKSSTVTEAIYKLTFIKPSSETGISSYQLYIVKGRGAVDPATAASSSNYSVGDPKAVEVTLNTNARDTSGASLVEGEEYTVYILSVASNTTTNRSTISNPSEAFKLEKAPAATQSTPPQ